MADLSIGAGNVDYNKWRKMTAQEIIKEESNGEEVPAEIVAWAEQMAAFSKIPDNVTYEKVDGDVGLDALYRLGLEDEFNPENQNAQAPTDTEEPDAVKDPALVDEEKDVDNNILLGNPVPGQAANEVPPEEEDPAEEEITLADPALTTDPEVIRKIRERRGILPA